MKLLKSMRKFICFNQKELIQYEYEVSEDHKNLRAYLDEKKDNINKEEITNLINTLIGTAYDDLIGILDENVEYIKNIFGSIHKNAQNPKITIKTIEDNIVLDFYRSDVLADLRESRIEENSGFSKIMIENNDIFISNDLETEFLSKNYINPRLDEKKRKKLKSGEVSWEDCWKEITASDSLKSSYKSTLIIPMAIRIKETDKERFIKHFSNDVDHHRDSRTIWGFLCFDYPEKNIFCNLEDEFKDAGYIIADIISLYLMFFYNHISGSKTFKKAINYDFSDKKL